MMKILIVLVAISVSEACRSTTVKPEVTTTTTTTTTTTVAPAQSPESLPVPDIRGITIKDGGVVLFSWDPVKVSEDNPILGLKIKLWEQEKRKVVKDNETEIVEEWQPVVKPIYELPRHKPAFEQLLPPDAVTTSFVVKKEEQYEVRIQSYSNNGDGPLSGGTGFKIYNDIAVEFK